VIFEQLNNDGCQSYLIGCDESCAAILIDPEISLVDRYHALATRDGLRVHYVLDTHTHADHFTASQSLAQQLGVPVIMHRKSAAPFVGLRVDDGESIAVGRLRLRVVHTPGHTDDSICLVLPDRVLTGDTLLIGATGRTDLPSGDPEQLYDSLFGGLLKLPPELLVFPAHDYKQRGHSTLGEEIASNPRLQKRERGAFVEQMRALDLKMPTHLTEALRTNRSGGKTVAQLIAEAASRVPFMAMEELLRRMTGGGGAPIVLDVRERDAYQAGHIPGALHLPRGQLELRVDDVLPDPTRRIVVCCELGKISTLAAATLQSMGFGRAVALDGGIKSWREAGYPLEQAPSGGG
jgi:glyoxylase-like metal-dependent hydrolase (beta-lactamase superfamily II)/rhodanese-related sulfurtransferase